MQWGAPPQKNWTQAVGHLTGDKGWKVEAACKVFKAHRQACYQAIKRSRKRHICEQELVRAIVDIRSCDPRIGAVKLWFMLKHTFEGNLYGRDRLIDLMYRYGLMLKRKPRIHTTNSNHRYRKYKNCIKELDLKEANQLWTSDITDIPIDGQVLYLHLVTDAYSLRIMGLNWLLACMPNTA